MRLEFEFEFEFVIPRIDMGFIKGIFNAVADPRLFFLLAVAALVVLVWKREQVASNAVGYGLLGVAGAVLRLRHRSTRTSG